MEFQVQLFVREHRNGFHTVEVIGESGLKVYTDNLDRAREELQLYLSDRIERLHPNLLSRYAAAENLRHVELELPGALMVHQEEGPTPATTVASALMSRDKGWQRVWLPRWGLRTWVRHGADVEQETRALLTEHVEALSGHDRLTLRAEGREWIEALTIEATPPPAVAFCGEHRGRDLLPEPLPREKAEDDDDDEHEDGGPPPDPSRKRKKRPPTPTLRQIGVPLSKLAEDGELDRAHGRDREVEELLAMLGSAGTTVYVVVGESGVGKSTLLNELVYRIRAGKAPKALAKRPVWFVDASRLIASDGWFGDWQRQCLDVVQESIDAETVWYLGDVLALLDAGKSVQSDQNVALLLKPFLAGRRLTIVGECTTRRWSQVEQRDAGFARMFTPYRLEEPGREQTRAILKAVGRELEKEQDVTFSTDGLNAIEELCRRYALDASQLGASLHFLRRVADDAGTQALERERTVRIDRTVVVDRFCAETGMPSFLVRDDLALDPHRVQAHFRGRLIGQPDALARMTDLVGMIKAGLSDLDRPLGSFLFVGPTGVGKTEMAKALAEFLFGRRERLTRYDMSEFVSADSVHRFVGSGGQEGKLISQVRRSPFGVLLLDEIEKAHPAVFDVLLQVLGEARLTDQAGRTADFRNTVVLMTSNLGVETFRARPGFGGVAAAAASFREHFEGEAHRFFRPEFLNRIDHIVPFAPLGADAIAQITDREVERFLGREGLRQRGVRLTLDDGVRPWLAERGVEPRYGARPLKRLIERAVAAPLAVHLSQHGGTAVGVGIDESGLVFEAAETDTRARARDAALETLSGRIANVRWQVQRWLDSEAFREVDHAIRLIDRLSQDRNFWQDAQWANERLASMARPRDLRDATTHLYAQLAALEDLAAELWHARDADPIEVVQLDLDACIERLGTVELELFGRRFNDPHRVTLYVQTSSDGEVLLRELAENWAALAAERGWSITPSVAVEAIAETVRRDAKRLVIAEKDPKRVRRERRATLPEAWSWIHGNRVPAPDPEADGDKRAPKISALLSFVTRPPVDTVRALQFEGPHCGALLASETGMVLEIDGEGSRQVRILATDRGEADLLPPLTAAEQLPTQRTRVIHRMRRVIRDLVLEEQFPIGPRLLKPWRAFLSAHLYAQVFGVGRHRAFAVR